MRRGPRLRSGAPQSLSAHPQVRTPVGRDRLELKKSAAECLIRSGFTFAAAGARNFGDRDRPKRERLME
jgi:hypothetical protein